MVTLTHNAAQFKAALRQGVARGSISRKSALLTIVKAVGSEIMRTAPVDTGRFKRAEAQALNGALGGAVFAASSVILGKSKLADNIDKQLRRQVDYWRGVKTWLERNDKAYTKGKGKGRTGRGRPTSAYKSASKLLTRAEKYLSEWEASGGTAAVIGLEQYQRWKEAQRRKDKDVDMVLTRATFRDKQGREFGGVGRLTESAGQTVATLINREPHAKIVEYKKRVRATAIRAAGAGLLRKVSQKYVREIGAATGFRAT